MYLNNYDEIVLSFLEDAVNVLKDYDRKIYGKLHYSKHRSDYAWKGIGAEAITEPTIRTLIYIELCEKYILYPEKHYSEYPKKRMDLGIYKKAEVYIQGMKDEDEGKKERNISPIAIEMKWCGISKRKKELRKWALKRLGECFRKLNSYSQSKNKYVLQMGFYEKEFFKEDITKKKIERAIERMDWRMIRHINPKILKILKFETEGPLNKEEKDFEKYYFYFILWKI